MWRCVDVEEMCRCGDMEMWRCGDMCRCVDMWRCGAVEMCRCGDVVDGKMLKRYFFD